MNSIDVAKVLAPFLLPLLSGGLLTFWWHYRNHRKRALMIRTLFALEIEANTRLAKVFRDKALPFGAPFHTAVFDKYATDLFVFADPFPAEIVSYYLSIAVSRRLGDGGHKLAGSKPSWRGFESSVLESGDALCEKIKDKYPHVVDWPAFERRLDELRATLEREQ